MEEGTAGGNENSAMLGVSSGMYVAGTTGVVLPLLDELELIQNKKVGTYRKQPFLMGKIITK